MSQLAQFVKVALLGTQRAAVPELAPESPLAGKLPIQPNADPESKLLDVAAAISLYEQVGQRVGQISAPPLAGAGPTDPWPACGPAPARRLAEIIDGRFQELLPEFLTALAQAQQRVPPQFLPNLLDRAAKLASLRPLLLPVLGQSGRWLAAQNPNWAYAAPEIDTWEGLTGHWREAGPAMRQTLLRQLRYLDPDRGRQLLESGWKTEAPASRALLIKTLEIGLTLADEPFLETALDDRSLVVRRKAAELLACLPTSRLCRRMTTNAGHLLRWDPAQPQPIAVDFPHQLNAQMLRDGVSLPQTKNLAQARSIQIVDMLGAVPLDHWTTKWDASPARIVASALDGRWPRTLIQGFTRAAERQNHSAWAETLLRQDNFTASTIRLVSVLAPAAFAGLVQEMSPQTARLDKDSILLKLFQKWPYPWSETTVEIWLAHLRRHIEQDSAAKTPEPTLRTTLRQFGKLCPPALVNPVAETLRPITTGGSVWASPVQEMVWLLKFRQAMLAEIKDVSQIKTG